MSKVASYGRAALLVTLLHTTLIRKSRAGGAPDKRLEVLVGLPDDVLVELEQLANRGLLLTEELEGLQVVPRQLDESLLELGDTEIMWGRTAVE